MRIRDSASEGEEPFNLVPLTDMVFNLLIFFMCATTFAQIEKDLAVQLPHASKFESLSAPPKIVTINIREDGATIVNQKTCSAEELSDLIAQYMKGNPDTSVLIRADKSARMQYFARVAEVCRAAGIGAERIMYIDDGSK